MICRTEQESFEMREKLNRDIDYMLKSGDVVEARQKMEYATDRIVALYNYRIQKIKEARES